VAFGRRRPRARGGDSRGPLSLPGPCSSRLLGGYLAAALFVWTVVPHDWTVPPWTTLAATLNAAK
jgi:hypothetical protein